MLKNGKNLMRDSVLSTGALGFMWTAEEKEASLLRLGTGSHKAGSNAWHCLQSSYMRSIMSREIKDSTENQSRCNNQSYQNLILQVAEKPFEHYTL